MDLLSGFWGGDGGGSGDRNSLSFSSPGTTHYVQQAGLELTDPTCLSLSIARIKDVSHHAQLPVFLTTKKLEQRHHP